MNPVVFVLVWVAAFAIARVVLARIPRRGVEVSPISVRAVGEDLVAVYRRPDGGVHEILQRGGGTIGTVTFPRRGVDRRWAIPIAVAAAFLVDLVVS